MRMYDFKICITNKTADALGEAERLHQPSVSGK